MTQAILFIHTLTRNELTDTEMKIKKLFFAFFATAFLIFALLFLSRLTMPKYASASKEGNLISEYYKEVDEGKMHDVVFIGDCEAYSAFVPPLLWEKYGIKSFVRASPSQSIAQSYYLACETLEYEIPKAIVLSVYALCREGSAGEAYNRMTLDGMRPSIFKLRAVRDSIGEDESAISYLVPLIRFHSRWDELETEDIEYLINRPCVSHNGYFMQKGILADDSGECEENASILPIPEENLDYFARIAKRCEERGVELILVKAPISSWRYPWRSEWDSQVEDFAAKNRIKYYNLIEYADVIGIDMTGDSYDGGFHLNVFGAEKTTLYFGEILATEHNIKGSNTPRDREVWQKKLDRYYKERN